MSIITNALKKAHETKIEQTEKENSPLNYLSSESFIKMAVPGRNRTTIRNRIILFGSVIGILIGLLFISLFLIPLSKKTITPAVPDSKTKEPTKISPAKKNAEHNFILNGIMYSPVEPKAVINGILVSEGAKIDNVIVLKISPASVKLASDAASFELHLQ